MIIAINDGGRCKVVNRCKSDKQIKNKESLTSWLVFIRENTIDSLSILKTFLIIIICCCSLVSLGFISPVIAEQNTISDDNEKRIDYTHHKTTVNGIQLHYVISGEGNGQGDPIVLLHGFPQTWYEWRHIIPQLITNNYAVIAPDMRGLGDSEKPQTGYDKKTIAEDIYQLVKKLGYSKIFLWHMIGEQQ